MGPKILIVDDSVMIRVVTAKALQAFECEIFEATNGAEGLATAGREPPDLIILDYSMPVMDGLEMLAKLKSEAQLRKVPIVMLTSEASRETVMKFARLGVRDYLIKPFKKELIVERIRRVLDLKAKAKGEVKARTKRFDEPLNLAVVDAKPAILEQFRAGLGETPWRVLGFSLVDQAFEFCTRQVPDVVFVSLSLPEDGAHTLCQLLRGHEATQRVPLFALSVKTALDEQAGAQRCGFAGIVTKPIDIEDIKTKVCQVLNLDTSSKFFQQRDDTVVLTLPPDFGPTVVNDVMPYLRARLTEAVDAGLDKLVLDLSPLEHVDEHLIKLGVATIQLCRELSLKYSMIGSEAIRQEGINYEETKDWKFVSNYEEAAASLGANPPLAA